mmetsp:Transcript_887/g.1844  ORF Transcript_887/g.1844 Transcript_887/m.1844 type:complete len:84 (-) Transcript_887:460-711(-)
MSIPRSPKPFDHKVILLLYKSLHKPNHEHPLSPKVYQYHTAIIGTSDTSFRVLFASTRSKGSVLKLDHALPRARQGLVDSHYY